MPSFATPAPPVDRSLKPQLGEDPPAADATPLCGTAARERAAIGAELPRSGMAAAGPCDGYACYDPLTATYLGADGYRHVCR